MALHGMDEQTKELVQQIKFFSKFEEDFFIEFADIDFERHVKQAYSIIETNKMKIKTSYLNQYALDQTHLPDLVKVFNHFNILNHIAVIFESYMQPNKTEILDEFVEINDKIKKFNTQTAVQGKKSLDKSLVSLDQFDKEKMNEANYNFLVHGVNKRNKKKKNSVKKQYINITDPPKPNFLYQDDFNNDTVAAYYNENLNYKALINFELFSSEEERSKNLVPLNYREKNYFYLKKGTKARKKAKKGI